MALVKFKDAYPDHRATFGDRDNAHEFSDYSVYTRGDDKVGSVKDALFEDTTGNIRYLIVDTGFWFFGKKVLLPIGLAHFDNRQQRIYVDGLTKEQVENLPEYSDYQEVDRDYEERVRAGYRNLGKNRERQFMGKEYDVDRYRAYPGSAALHGVTEQPAGTSTAVSNTGAVSGNRISDSDRYDYNTEPGLYAMDESAHQPIRLYQERLIADKDHFKTGTVTVGKRVETETQEATVPVENERVVIERSTPSQSQPAAGTPDFHEGEVAKVETYGEKADIHKEAFVREEVNVRKEVDRDTVTERETLRREELDVNTEGDPNVKRR